MVNYDEQRKQGYRERFQAARRKQARWIAVIVVFLLFLLILWGLSVLWPSAEGVWSILAMLAALGLVVSVGIGVVMGIINGRCPACGALLAEELWTAKYCSQCGAQLEE